LTARAARSTRKLLIVAPAWLGDTVMASSLVTLLARTRPGVEIHVLAPPATAPVAERIPGVTVTHTLPVRHGELAIGVRRAAGRALAAHAFEQAIVLPNSWKSALCPLFAGIPRRTGWLGEARIGVLNDVRRLDVQRFPRMVERFAALGVDAGAPPPREIPRPALRTDRARASTLRRALGLASEASVLALCPGAEYGPAKRWPAQHFAVVAAHHAARGGEVWILGAAGDRESAGAIVAGVAPAARGRVQDLTGRTTLHDAIDLLGETDCVVSNDSGLMHVAAALDRPLVAIYGSSSPEFTPPLSPHARVVRSDLHCSPCFDRVCRFGHTNCLAALEPARIVAELPPP
jgi:heptosyltransferase-2